MAIPSLKNKEALNGTSVRPSSNTIEIAIGIAIEIERVGVQ